AHSQRTGRKPRSTDSRPRFRLPHRRLPGANLASAAALEAERAGTPARCVLSAKGEHPTLAALRSEASPIDALPQPRLRSHQSDLCLDQATISVAAHSARQGEVWCRRETRDLSRQVARQSLPEQAK